MNEHADLARKNRETSEHGVLAYRAITARARRTKRDLRARIVEYDKLAAELLNLIRSINLENSKLIIEHGDSLRDMQRLDDRNVQQVAAANATIGGLSRGLTLAEEEIRRLGTVSRADLGTLREQSERIADLEATLAQRDETIAEHGALLEQARAGSPIEISGVKLQACDEYGRTATDRELAQHRAHETGHPSTSDIVQRAAQIIADRATEPEPVACGCSTHRTAPTTTE